MKQQSYQAGKGKTVTNGLTVSKTTIPLGAELDHAVSPRLFSLYIVYTIFFFLNLPSRVPGLGVVRPTLLLALVILTIMFSEGLFFAKKDHSRTTTRLKTLLIYMVITLPFVKWPGSVITQNLPDFVKAVLFYFFTAKIVDSPARLRNFLLVAIGCQVIRVYEPLLLHLTTGYWGSAAHMGAGQYLDRLAGAPHDIVNPNGLAYVALSAIPFMHYMMTETTKKRHLLAYLALMPGLMYAFILTGSRSGMVAFAALAFVIFLKSQRKGLLLVVGLVGAMIALAVMSPDQKDRYLSIISDDTKNATTAGSRNSGVTKDLSNFKRRPVFGHGVGTSLEANANYQGRGVYSHTLYTEILVELGAVGSVLFLAVLWSIIQNSRVARRKLDSVAVQLARASPKEYALLRSLANAIEAWVGMGLVFSIAQYGLSEYNWYLIGGLSVVLFNLTTRLMEGSSQEVDRSAK